MLIPNQLQLPIQPVNEPILCSPYEEPTAHWVYDTTTGAASQIPGRRPASYWYKTERTGSAQCWKSAVNHWGQLGLWRFHVCRDPQMLGRELEWCMRETK